MHAYQSTGSAPGQICRPSRERLLSHFVLVCIDQAGIKLAAKQAALQDSAQRLQAAAALRGDRPGLPVRGPPEAAAAEQLLSAQAMLAACPDLEAAKCAVVEVRWQMYP